jgi:uncharacterized protein (DUF111 family)
VKAGEFWHPAIPVEHADTTENSKAEKAASPDPAPAHTLKATKKKRRVAEKRCRVVLEMADDKQVAEHCMSGTGELGISTREMYTLSRLFTKAENLGLDLMGVATKDESYASIQSQRVDDKGKASQTLKSVTKTAIPTDKMRIAEDYKLIKPVVSKAP